MNWLLDWKLDRSAFLSSCSKGLRLLLLRVGEAHRRIGLERTVQPQLLADLAHRRHDLLTEQPDAGHAVFVADVAVVAPQRHDARPRLLQDAPQPRLDDLPALVTQVREAGLPVELHVEGERRELPVGLELSAYRIVQEALTNALKHAGRARASVNVRYGLDSLELEILDDGPGESAPVASGGHGLAGMRERVALYGGSLDAGLRPSGGFAVRAHLPLG